MKRLKNVAVSATVFMVAMIFIASAGLSAYFEVLPLAPPEHQIGVIEVNGLIDEYEADRINWMINYALENEAVKAVVLEIDSPGGLVGPVEEVYLNLLKLRCEKPVVASITGLGTSGSYYISIAANYVYAVPSAFVGSIGVVGFAPKEIRPSEQVIESGPYKLVGTSRRGFIMMVKEVTNNFLDAVEAQRGSKLKLTRLELSKALIYLGAEAAQYGLVDEVGSSATAIKKAAKLAGITEYKVVRLNELVKLPSPIWWWGSKHSQPEELNSLEDLKGLRTPPVLYYIYLPASGEEPETFTYHKSSIPPSMGEGKPILIDYSHENAFVPEEIDTLTFELISRGYSISYLQDPANLGEKLKEAKAFIVISPTQSFSKDELNSIRKFVTKGGKILLILEPTRADPLGINSLAAEFGILFSRGYLYNQEENEANYRNIYITSFKDSPITHGLKRVVFYTATSIHSRSGGVAYTSENTYSTASEARGAFPTIVYLEELNVLAVGDQTFLKEPYSHLQDCYHLIINIADFLTS